jgi:asparagine synthase (glutamine-hydrolysing)
MCGICGKLTCDGKPVQEGLIRKMTSVLSHRGPDGEGVYLSSPHPGYSSAMAVGLGHKRLSIIDLSDAGRQPMSNEDKTVWLVFNGEIYNFQTLRDELERKGHRFTSRTDSETIIHLYEEEGIGAVKRLVGMFALAIWDEKTQSLCLARDHTGIKPLVYCRGGNSFVFASEIKGILQDPEVSREMDWDALELYLTLNYIPAPYTIFRGIRKLKPGHILVMQKGEIREEAYWNIDLNINGAGGAVDLEAQKHALYKALEEAVQMQMMADVPLGAFLSGGIDSSILVGLMARNSSRPVKTYTIGYQDMPMYDETAYARETALFNKTDHHEFKLNAEDVINAIPQALASQDEPFGDSSAVPVFIVSRETARDVKVAISGDGGDELFAGYRMYRGENLYAQYCRIPAWIRKKIIEPAGLALSDSRDEPVADYLRVIKKFLRGAKGSLAERFLAWNDIFPREMRKEILGVPGRRDRDLDLGLKILAARLDELHHDDINRMLYADLKVSLPGDMLKKVDSMSMFHSLEVRVPILDHRVCELAFSMGGGWKMRNGKGKYILTETFKNIIPPSLHNRPKSGFEMPVSKWLKTDLKYLIEEYLSKDGLARQGIFNYTVIKQLIVNLAANRSDTSWQLWNLIAFQVWYRHYGQV